MQVCTVIRFPSRFVPLSELFLRPPSHHRSLSGFWSVTISADRGAKHSSWAFSFGLQLQRLLNSRLCFSHSSYFPLCWTIICTLSVNYELLILLISCFLFPLFFSLFSFPFCCLSTFWPCCTSCISDGLPSIWPWLSFWRAVQHLSETFSEGRPQLRHVCAFNTLTNLSHSCSDQPCISLLSHFPPFSVMLHWIDFMFDNFLNKFSVCAD